MAIVDRAARILLIEDEEYDAWAIATAFEEGKVLVDLHREVNGERGLAYLRTKAAEGTPPDLVLLDLNLPGMSGLEVLEEIKTDPTLKTTPVVVLTTSEAGSDVLQSYQQHANCYITKPVDTDKLARTIDQLDGFFFRLVALPTEST